MRTCLSTSTRTQRNCSRWSGVHNCPRDQAPNSTLSLKNPSMSMPQVGAIAPADLTRLATLSIKSTRNKPVRMARPMFPKSRSTCKCQTGNLPTLVNPSPTAITTMVASNLRAASLIKITIVMPTMTASPLMKLRSLYPRSIRRVV